MATQFASVQSLRRVFQDGFSVQDVAEPLVSFDAEADAVEVRRFMDARKFELIGLRRDGLVAGFVDRADLDKVSQPGSRSGEFLRAFEEPLVIVASATLVELVQRFKERQRLFVSLLGQVGGIVSRSDLQKPAARMWLFGMVTLIEMRFGRMAELFCPGDSWKQYVSAGRIEKAEQMLTERTRRNVHVGLLDCLQFSDKGQIVARCEELRGQTQFTSRRQVEEIVKRLERLRNNLAHAQDIVGSDWDTIVQLAENLDQILQGPSALR